MGIFVFNKMENIFYWLMMKKNFCEINKNILSNLLYTQNPPTYYSQIKENNLTSSRNSLESFPLQSLNMKLSRLQKPSIH